MGQLPPRCALVDAVRKGGVGRLEEFLAGLSEPCRAITLSRPVSSRPPIASSDAIRPGALVACAPARPLLHTASSVVARPWSANMLDSSPFATYSTRWEDD